MGQGIAIFSILAFIAFLIWNRSRIDLDRRRLQLDAQSRILEKLGPGQALTDFLGTEEGKRFLSEWTGPEASTTLSRETRRRILVLTTLGLIALFAGFFFIMSVSIPTALDGRPLPTNPVWLGIMPVFLLTGGGVGALIAAWFMHRLSKKWGVLEGRQSSND